MRIHSIVDNLIDILDGNKELDVVSFYCDFIKVVSLVQRHLSSYSSTEKADLFQKMARLQTSVRRYLERYPLVLEGDQLAVLPDLIEDSPREKELFGAMIYGLRTQVDRLSTHIK